MNAASGQRRGERGRNSLSLNLEIRLSMVLAE
jgi:hypothetical protein